MIPKHAVLHRAPPGARDLIPPIGKRHARRADARIDVDDDQRKRSEDDIAPRGRAKRDRRNRRADEMVSGAVVVRRGEVNGERVEVSHCKTGEAGALQVFASCRVRLGVPDKDAAGCDSAPHIAPPRTRSGASRRPRDGVKNRRRPTLPGPCGPSTIVAEGLNCSVRNGKRCFPLAIATGNRSRPRPPRAFKTAQHANGTGIKYPSSPRPISTGLLQVLPPFQIRPINLVVYQGSYSLKGMGELISRSASRLDAFSGYPIRT